jgi:hypothetical protein
VVERGALVIDLSLISLTPEQFILEVVDPDEIVVINLDRRPDRWEAMHEAWPPEVASRFVRFLATDGQLVPVAEAEANIHGRPISLERSAGEIGCRNSWIRAVEQHGPALYLEDDARPCELWPYGPPPDNAGVVLLGGNLGNKVSEPGWAAILGGVWGAHAVWIRTQPAAGSLVQAWRNPVGTQRSLDLAWRIPLRQAHAVIAVPQIVIQVDTGSDIDKGRVFAPEEDTAYWPWCSLKGDRERRQR